MALLLIHPNMPCLISSCGRRLFSSADNNACIIRDDYGVNLFDAYTCSMNNEDDIEGISQHGLDRHSFAICFEKGKAVWSCGCDVINWGGYYEADLVIRRRKALELGTSKVLSQLTRCFNNKYSRLMLIKEGSIKLFADEKQTGEQLCYIVGDGDSGELSTLEASNKSFVAVKTTGKSLYKGRGGERLIIADSSLNSILDIVGDECGISEGRPWMIERLDSIEGYEMKTSFILKDGYWLEDSANVGFYTRSRHIPANNIERALGFVQSAGLRLADSARTYLSDELSKNLTDDEITEFFGSFRKALPLPAPFKHSAENDTVQIGLIRKEVNTKAVNNTFLMDGICGIIDPDMFTFIFKNGSIVDIEA